MGYLDAPYLGLHNEPYPELRPAPNRGWVRGLLDSITPDEDTARNLVGLLSNWSLRQKPPDVPIGDALKAVADATPIGPMIDTAVQSDELRAAAQSGDSYGTGKSIGDLAKTVAMAFVPGSKGAKVKPIRAYHGSPHNFDRFDISKIGTGEGAQAYGHGLYFAEDPTIARTYRAKVSAMHGADAPTVGGRPINWDDPVETAAFELARHGGDRAAAADFFGKTFARGSKVPDILRSDVKLPSVELPGHMYEVGIHADPAKLIDWDKPLSRQSPEVQRALATFGINADKAGVDKFDDALLGALKGGPTTLPKQPPDPTGGAIYESSKIVPGGYRDPSVASANLKYAGIPGIKYLDQGSRNQGAGTSNYVVFDPKIIEIMRKYGLPIAAGGAAAATVPGLLNEGQTY